VIGRPTFECLTGRFRATPPGLRGSRQIVSVRFTDLHFFPGGSVYFPHPRTSTIFPFRLESDRSSSVCSRSALTICPFFFIPDLVFLPPPFKGVGSVSPVTRRVGLTPIRSFSSFFCTVFLVCVPSRSTREAFCSTIVDGVPAHCCCPEYGGSASFEVVCLFFSASWLYPVPPSP